MSTVPDAAPFVRSGLRNNATWIGHPQSGVYVVPRRITKGAFPLIRGCCFGSPLQSEHAVTRDQALQLRLDRRCLEYHSASMF